MKNQEIKFNDLLKDKKMKNFPFSFNNLLLIIDSNVKPAYSFVGRKMESTQNENMLVKGNGARVPISKFITE